MSFVCYNGIFLPSDQPGLLADNRSFKWGDGVFETIKVYKGQLLLQPFHFDRLATSLRVLQMQAAFTVNELENNILALCKKNGCIDLARVRLGVYRNENNTVGYTIEALALDESVMHWNKKGYKIDGYPYARKACDIFSGLKTANYLLYVMANKYAKENGLQEVLVFNSYNHICDASKANVFIIRNQEIFTPGIDQGCISGVMRRFVLEEVKKMGFAVKQIGLTEAMLLEADECFLTNAIQGIRWVSQYRHKNYSCIITKQLFASLFSTASC